MQLGYSYIICGPFISISISMSMSMSTSMFSLPINLCLCMPLAKKVWKRANFKQENKFVLFFYLVFFFVQMIDEHVHLAIMARRCRELELKFGMHIDKYDTQIFAQTFAGNSKSFCIPTFFFEKMYEFINLDVFLKTFGGHSWRLVEHFRFKQLAAQTKKESGVHNA